jgi:hypothetical protein
MHIWYSAFVPPNLLAKFQRTVIATLNQYCCGGLTGMEYNDDGSRIWRVFDGPYLQPGLHPIQIVLDELSSRQLLSRLEIPSDLDLEKAIQIRHARIMHHASRDWRDRALLLRPASWRLCTKKYWEDGVLLPFGASRNAYRAPNP